MGVGTQEKRSLVAALTRGAVFATGLLLTIVGALLLATMPYDGYGLAVAITAIGVVNLIGAWLVDSRFAIWIALALDVALVVGASLFVVAGSSIG